MWKGENGTFQKRLRHACTPGHACHACTPSTCTPGRTSAWWDNFAAQVCCDRLQIVVAYSCGRAKTIRKCYREDGNIFINGGKKKCFQATTDTCGQGLTFARTHNTVGPSDFPNKAQFLLMIRLLMLQLVLMTLLSELYTSGETTEYDNRIV